MSIKQWRFASGFIAIGYDCFCRGCQLFDREGVAEDQSCEDQLGATRGRCPEIPRFLSAVRRF
jgi:hypothetical protein